MKSIRLSLMLYFLGLLSAALGGASLLFYQTALTTLRDKQEATRALIGTTYDQKHEEILRRVDEKLLARAQALADRTKIETDWSGVRERQLQVLGVWVSQPANGTFFRACVWFAENTHTQLNVEATRRLVKNHIKLSEREFGEDDSQHEYFQIESPRAVPLLSLSLGGRELPPASDFAPGAVLKWKHDDLELEPETPPLRRILLKTSSARRASSFSFWNRFAPQAVDLLTTGVQPQPATPLLVGLHAARFFGRPGGEPGPRGPGGSRYWGSGREQPPSMFLVVQCAIDTEERDAQLATLLRDRDEELAALDRDTTAALTRHRNSLLLISILTFLATVLGSFWLVWLGLRPVRRLSDAVSRVSTRDFRLPLDETELPIELQPIAQRLVGALEMLKRAFAREKQATADISHELRTPLAAMITTLDVALRKPRSAEQLREMLQECRLSAQQMNLIIERMLTLARLDAGAVVVRPQPVDVAELAERCAAVVRPLAEAQGLSLNVQNQCATPAEEGENPSRATTDPDKLREVVNNLLHNAVQYNRPAGHIDLIVARNNGHVEVEVRATGIGIAPDTIEHIFERFYRADPARNTDGLNAGLGLSIVKEYVDLLGGSIAVESTEGQGSSFRVVLPV